MRLALPLALLLTGLAPVEAPRIVLVSLQNIPIGDTQDIKSFSLVTWGVRVKRVCHIPAGWWIKAGSSGTSDGVLAGEGSQGATWFNVGSPTELHSLVLAEITGPVTWSDTASGTGTVPATFKGSVTLETDDGDRQVPLGRRNIVLERADRCPAAAK